MPGAKHWCFTYNNYTAAIEAGIVELVENGLVEYLVYGREVGENGTPHLQGYIVFATRRTLPLARALVGGGHFEVKRGTSAQAITYCKKDGDFEEHGVPPVEAGKRTDIDAYHEWLRGLRERPTEADIAMHHPGIYMKYKANAIRMAAMICPPIELEAEAPRAWQQEIIDMVRDEQADKRQIWFLIDPVGNVGKSWLIRKMITLYPDRVQVLGNGRSVDIAHAVDETRDIFIFDIPRTQMEFLNYELLEKLKDRIIFSPKYESVTKVLRKIPWVFVFGNEEMDRNKMTRDRYYVVRNFAN